MSSRSFHSHARRARLRADGFTLLEILVTIGILVLISGLAIGHLVSVQRNADKSVARLMVQQSMKLPLHTYRTSMREFPSTAEGLQALLRAPLGKESNWAGPYLDGGALPTDPWGELYHYAYPGTHNRDGYDLWSSGPDKRSGTDDDIGNWQTKAALESGGPG